MVLATEKEDKESYTSKQMLKQPDAAEFIKATTKETTDHESRDPWTVIPTSIRHNVGFIPILALGRLDRPLTGLTLKLGLRRLKYLKMAAF